MEMKASHLILLTILLVSGFALLKAIAKSLKEGSATTLRFTKKIFGLFSAKKRASNMICNYCGRTLDQCSCPSNRGVSMRKRIKKYKLEKKARRILANSK
jgi:hypothetical protein